MAAALSLQACAPSPSELSLQAVAKTSDRIVAAMTPALYARLDSLGVSTARNRTVGLVFPPGGEAPPNATCVADLKAGLERQLRQLASRTRIDFRLVDSVEKATVIFVVGDTADMLEKRIPPLRSWMDAAERRTSSPTMKFQRNYSTPHSISDFVEGVRTDDDARLIFAASLIHWFELHNRRGRKDCTLDFVERLARIYSAGLELDFEDQYANAGRQARAQVGPSAYEADGGDIANFMNGIFFCAQFVDRTKLTACALEIVKLSSEEKP
ncbi:hypothetical protein [Reyranella sp.]|uniref:hypothetical protein n=1 Tax=Reyranella sp. TaxID=1929291 RepID=UPI0026361302|nr:hypothetical protein [Reyranella sp.]